MKICSVCGLLKTDDKFNKQYSLCKKCKSNYDKEYCANNKKKISDRNKKLRQNNIEKFLWRKARNRAVNKGIDFKITIADIIIPGDNICPLLGIKMCTMDYIHNVNSYSLDRIDSNKGYIKENIRVISHKANTSKNNCNIQEYNKIVSNFSKVIKLGVKLNSVNFDVNSFINVKRILDSARNRTKKYSLPKCNIDRSYIKYIFPKDNKCPLLDVEFKDGKGLNKPIPTSPTLDRIIPFKGYVRGNVVFISHKANLVKGSLCLEEMRMILKNWKDILVGNGW